MLVSSYVPIKKEDKNTLNTQADILDKDELSSFTKEKVHSEAIKDAVKEEEIQKDKFNTLLSNGTRVLYKLNSVFPFAFFPDTLTVDCEKVTLKLVEFFFASEIRSIHIKNISHVYVDTSPFFATMTLLDQSVMSEKTAIAIPYLWKGQAMRARRIIQGLIVAHKEKIDVQKIHDNDLVNKLEEIGRMH